MVRGRGKGGERGGLPPTAFLLVKNKNAGDHTRKPGDAHMSTNTALYWFLPDHFEVNDSMCCHDI